MRAPDVKPYLDFDAGYLNNFYLGRAPKKTLSIVSNSLVKTGH